ncbi:NAD-dependent epimerase/dehydratase family protein [Parapedobacter indicus]|uniref:dTDP-L-rhamnose 4-epimerase n=1 Tax=Parapedobacter indicus TaxID=1477437 RepID=A0A1I3N094_9SPHI|nr:NAD-dependent epimerase/dehydratase family protein [Parapedobacter indicus]PPL00836.1 dTDP-L-rhamnose 4-epimerase [Parapedobacter indicus]SFJ02659.1 dTDP-L-rhamnose 4-epimerase [Parapedobacter indicus]
MNILISGGAGFIGSSLALRLVELGHRVTVLDNLLSQVHGREAAQHSYLYQRIQKKVSFVYGDVTKREDWEKCLAGQQVVVHLAAETGTGQSMYKIAHYTSVNMLGTAQLLDILTNKRDHSVTKVLIASSRAVYGEGKYKTEAGEIIYPNSRKKEDLDCGRFEIAGEVPNQKLKVVATDELSKLHPTSVYGLTKLYQEQLLTTVCPTIGITPVVMRFQNVYGPGQSLQNPYTGILSIFSSLIRQGRPINVFEDGLESRDFVYIDDVVEATIRGILHNDENGGVFNVGVGVPTTVLEVAKTLMQHYGKEVKLNISGNYRLGDIRHNFADISHIQSVLGYKPKVMFSEGIGRFAAWVKEQNVMVSDYDGSLAEMADRGLLKQ